VVERLNGKLLAEMAQALFIDSYDTFPAAMGGGDFLRLRSVYSWLMERMVALLPTGMLVFLEGDGGDLGGFAAAIERAREGGSATGSGADSLERQFTALVGQYEDMIRRVCFGYARSASELDDIYQDALINLWRGLHTFRGESSEKTWIYRITLNTCVSTMRRRRRETVQESIESFADIIDEDDERKEQLIELHQRIERLSPLDKAVVMMWLDEASYEEIAASVGMSKNVVAARIHRAKDKLRKIN
ncbi:MAG: sigma-70 family RNA polymerase sigma factor, partial [Muribaculaceae bacterium]|nr:sigma-70 family RNA polymerase sigma factor [Muribaculaceae bacterium]